MRKFTLIVLVLVIVCLYGCIAEPMLIQNVQVDVLTGHVVEIKSYKLPKGNFRGVFWPSEKRDNYPQSFEIWINSDNKLTGNEESYYYIPAPSEFINEITEATDDWIIEKSALSENRMTYSVKKKDGRKVLRLYLPFKERHYSFSVLKNENGDEIVLFMNLSNYIKDKNNNGIFGWVVVK